MDSPSKRSREEGAEEGDVRTTIDPVEFEWSAAETSKRPHLSIQEASKLMALSIDAAEIGTSGTDNINWAADAVFRNEYLFRGICTLGQFPPIVHMSLKRAFPRQYAKAHPKQDIFQWVWNELLAKVVQCVPWHSDGLYDHGKTAGERFRDGFSMEKSALHITGGVLLEILQGENYSTAAAADSKNRGSRDLDIFCTLASKEKQLPTWEWYQRFSGSVFMSGRHMDPPVAIMKRDQSPAFEYDASISGCLFSQHVLDFGTYAPSAAGFQSICLTLLSPAISVPQYIRQYFDLNYCKNFLTGRGLVVMSPKSVLHKTHHCHDLTRYVNVRDTSHTGISRISGRFLKYADRGYSIVAAPSRPDYLASVIYQLIAALGGPHSILKVDPKEWLDSGMEAALNSEYIRKINNQWVNFEKFVLFLNPKTAPIARIFLEEFNRPGSEKDFPSLEEWIKPYAEWVQKLQDVDFSVLEPLLRKSLEKKNQSTPATLDNSTRKNIRDLFKL